MAKCSICGKTKGKRNCRAFGGSVCSLCCGQSRVPDKCEGCSFFTGSQQARRYDKVPCFAIRQMSESIDLEGVSQAIEGGLCSFDHAQGKTATDGLCQKILERLLDQYHFHDETLSFAEDAEAKGVAHLEEVIRKDLDRVPEETLVKVLATVYRSIQRHADGRSAGRAYLDFIYEYVGIRTGTGLRLLPDFVKRA